MLFLQVQLNFWLRKRFLLPFRYGSEVSASFNFVPFNFIVQDSIWSFLDITIVFGFVLSSSATILSLVKDL